MTISTHRTKKTKQNCLNQVRVLLPPSTGAFVTQEDAQVESQIIHHIQITMYSTI